MQSEKIRQTFLDFFESKKHKIVESAPMVSKNDSTLMFVNAGMNPFKEYFLGQKKIAEKRITNTQKCLRVSGKHNDLEEVGKDTYHHTMFEMLGNWSFGEYFKKEAIAWSWELLTDIFKINKENLYVTIFKGSKADNVPMDKESFDFWKEIVAEDTIILGNKKDNFWEMGGQGPCGPCSEIHIDLRSKEEKQKIAGKDLVNKDHPEVIEIWNLVFIQFNRTAQGNLENLPKKHVDTGMGFERLCRVLQNKNSNYDTDIFTPLIEKISELTNFKYGKNENTDVAIRVIADHLRAVCFAIADGELPSNTGAGYVIRRILRRAIRYGFSFLDRKEAFIFKLVAILEKQMGAVFPELKKEKNLITKIIQQEENSFLKTLAQGISLLEKIIKTQIKSKIICGEKAFELYDAFGFPIDLTNLVAKESGFSVDMKGFEKCLEQQKKRSKKAAAIQMGNWEILNYEKTDTEFVGYEKLKTKIKILRYREIQDKKLGKYYQLVFDKTPFYAESGGQIGDKGLIQKNDANETIEIFDTKKENNLILHFAKKLPQDFAGAKIYKAKVDKNLREAISKNHSATHLLHEALRKILGKHVGQKGSLVNEKKLRFDFSHFQKMSEEEIKKVENAVNEKIEKNIFLEEKKEVPIEEAKKEALALFGEKYEDKVRMICFGNSKELCGGTHVQNTKDIWYFKILGESAVAAGVRRIEAITGKTAKNYFEKGEKALENIKKILKKKDFEKEIQNLQKENQNLKKQIEKHNAEKIKTLKTQCKQAIQTKENVNFIVKKIDLESEFIKNLAFELGNDIENLFLFLGSEIGEKALLTCYVSKNIISEKINAHKIIKETSQYIKGGGGGQKFFATAGGKNPEGIKDAINHIKKILKIGILKNEI